MTFIRSVTVSLVAGAVLSALAGCVPAPDPVAAPPGTAAPRAGYVQSVQANEVDLWRASNNRGLTLDLRMPEEWNDPLGHLDGAVQIPYSELESRLGEISSFRDRPVLVYCKDGPRAQAAAQSLSRQGYRDVAWLDGGIQAYRAWLEAR